MNADGSHRTGMQLGAFRLDERLGRGAFKVVYAATNLQPAANGYPPRVAVCIPHYQDAEARKLLEHERNIVRTLRHPAIVEQYGLEEVDNLCLLVMELVDGQPLNQVLAERGPLPLEQAVEIVRQVGEALDYAHDGLAIHRDIKPGNLMLRPDGRVKVLDFGLARLMSHSQYKASTRVGSVAYMAPEQFEGATGLNTDLRAHFPLIYLHTHEEDRALAALGRVCDVMAADRPLDLLVWNETRGLQNRQGAAVTSPGNRDPVAALQHVIELRQEGIYVFLDMHRHFTPVTVRLVRDAIWAVRRQRKSLVFVSPNYPSRPNCTATRR